MDMVFTKVIVTNDGARVEGALVKATNVSSGTTNSKTDKKGECLLETVQVKLRIVVTKWGNDHSFSSDKKAGGTWVVDIG